MQLRKRTKNVQKAPRLSTKKQYTQDQMGNIQNLMNVLAISQDIQPHIKQNGKSQQTKLKTIDFEVIYQKLCKKRCAQHMINNKQRLTQDKQKQEIHFKLQDYIKVHAIWGGQKCNDNKIIKKTSIISNIQNISGALLKRLRPKHWLNDQIINSYIQLLSCQIQKTMSETTNSQTQKHFPRLLNSYLMSLKQNSSRISSQINKNKLSRKNILIIPMNQDQHWFFVIIYRKALYLCDSLLGYDTQPNPNDKQLKQNNMKMQIVLKKQYATKKTIKNVIQFFKHFYSIPEVTYDMIHLVHTFPQQNNTYDCGMMLLLGIKCFVKTFLNQYKLSNKVFYANDQDFIKNFVKDLDVSVNNLINKSQNWNFCQEDIYFYRYQFVKEIIQERIILS